jgi:sensor histidine kinase regulating citrate/malate metabolism
MQKFRHDIHNHFQYLITYIESGENGKVESYLRQLAMDIEKLSMTIHTGNPIMDAILNVKSQVASRESIEFDVDAVLPEKLSISENDLVVIMGNILDNAIKASSQLADNVVRRIKVIAKTMDKTVLISVMNAFTDTPKKSVLSLSSKFKAREQGLGLQIVTNRVEKYGGYVNIEKGKQLFEVTIIIPNK